MTYRFPHRYRPLLTVLCLFFFLVLASTPSVVSATANSSDSNASLVTDADGAVDPGMETTEDEETNSEGDPIDDDDDSIMDAVYALLGLLGL